MVSLIDYPVECWEKGRALGSIRAKIYELPKDTKISLDAYCRDNDINDRPTKVLHYLVADEMAANRALLSDEADHVWVFSKDVNERYSWQPAGYIDRIVNYLKTF